LSEKKTQKGGSQSILQTAKTFKNAVRYYKKPSEVCISINKVVYLESFSSTRIPHSSLWEVYNMITCNWRAKFPEGQALCWQGASAQGFCLCRSPNIQCRLLEA